jgi:hypothetical protein
MQLIDIALLAQYRGMGIGETLLNGLCAEATHSGISLRLSVRFGSPAERLYTRAGFVRTSSDGLNISMEFRGKCDLAPCCEEESQPPAEPAGSIEQSLTGRYFRTLVGHTMTAQNTDGEIVLLVLEAVRILTTSKRCVAVEPGDSFALSFTGPYTPMLKSAEAIITPVNAAPMNIFLVPLGINDGAARYEAVFNRMRPL